MHPIEKEAAITTVRSARYLLFFMSWRGLLLMSALRDREITGLPTSTEYKGVPLTGWP
jgi:hypothetical protein